MSSQEILRALILAQKPNDEQRTAIFADQLEYLLRASPGSGKTWTSSWRFIWRGALREQSRGGIALLSFTNTAIREFQDATIKAGRRNLLSDPNYVGTFDSFLERFLFSPFGHLLLPSRKRPKLLTDAHQVLLKGKPFHCFLKFSDNKEFPVPSRDLIPLKIDDKFVLGYSSLGGGAPQPIELANPNSKPLKELLHAGYYGQEQRKFWAYWLLRTKPHICKLLSRRFPEIIVDEAQDTNEWLLECLKLLRSSGSQITLVGDPDQCIFEFNRASPESLAGLKNQWSIVEFPLNQSFRCNNHIALAVRHVGGHSAFRGCGDSSNPNHIAYIIRDSETRSSQSVKVFESLLQRANVSTIDSAIICRAHKELDSIRGETNYLKLKGITQDFAKASFLRDCRRDYKGCVRLVDCALRSVVEDDKFWEAIDSFPESVEAKHFHLTVWRFVKSKSGLPPVNISGGAWVLELRKNLEALLTELHVAEMPALGTKIRKTGFDDKQTKLPMFEEQSLFPAIRQATIHQVKGQTIGAVLVIGSNRFWTSVVKSIMAKESSEDRRLAYVAMTRAKHALVVALPASHFDKYNKEWLGWGFALAK